jgi:DNA-binding transcriptional LysR family regulator
MSDHLEALRLFVRVARLGSFSAAGRELGVPQSTASRTIAALERDIGAPLLIRTTRAVTLTDVGADFMVRVEAILADLEEAAHAARGSGDLRGLLRVGLGSTLGVKVVIPRLKPFMDRHPRLKVELILDDQRQDLVQEGVDVALRFGALADSRATARKLRSWPRVITASPAYLSDAPPLATPADLAAHAVILGPQGPGDWVFRRDGATTSVRIEGRLKIPLLEGTLAAAVAGMGVVLTSLVASRAELKDGLLVRVLSDWDVGTVDLHAVFIGGAAAKPSARALVTYLAEALHDA